MTLKYTVARATPLGNTSLPGLGSMERQDVYSRSILSLNATVGRLNNFLNPRRGFLIRPLLETGGGLTGFITSDVEYWKASNDVIGYLPITRRTNLSGRLTVGWMRPFGKSKDQNDPRTEFRFERIRFYAGGSGDVRGWANQLLGPKLAQADSATVDSEGRARAINARYESIGGETKLSGSIEFRLPFPGTSSDLGLATFLDFGQAYDEGGYNLKNLHYGTGVGLRYQTPVGFLRFDLATKINPNDEDLQDPEAVYLFQNGFAGPPKDRFWRRFKVHLSLGQRF
jgi:outer membrane protein insertion porin family